MMQTKPVAVASRSFSRHEQLRRELLERHQRVTFNESGRVLAGDDLVNFLRGHPLAITGLERLDEEVLARLPELEVVSKYGVGLDMLDLDAMQHRGIRLGWLPGVNCQSVAELTISCMISLLHRVPEAQRVVQEGQWRQIVGRQLLGKTVGIVGCGNVGQVVAVTAKALGCRVLANDIRDYPEFYSKHGVEPVSFADLLRLSDVVTFHVPLDDSTRNMLDATSIGLMRRNAVLINHARSGIVDEGVLLSALEKGYLAGAALDVLVDEPPRDSRFSRLSNVLVTPHIGGSTEEAILAMGRAAIVGLDSASLPSEINCISRYASNIEIVDSRS